MNEVNVSVINQRGISMVEIMIGLLISSILIGGVVQIFASNKQTYHLQDELSRVQESGRIAMEILQRSIRGAGFDNVTGAFVPATTIDGASDSIHIISSGNIGCLGPAVVNDIFTITNVGTTNSLACSAAGAAPQPLIDNVQTMQFLYGVDDDGNRTADRYVNATTVNAGLLWNSVVSVRVGLLLGTSPLEQRSRMILTPMTFATVAANPLLAIFDVDNDGVPELFDTDGDGVPDTNVAQDNRLYRVFTSTITLRNRVP